MRLWKMIWSRQNIGVLLTVEDNFCELKHLIDWGYYDELGEFSKHLLDRSMYR